MSTYEERRRKNIEENRRILEDMGVPKMLSNPIFKKTAPVAKKPGTGAARKSLKRKREPEEGDDELGEILNDESLMEGSRRRSSRHQGKRIRYSDFGIEDDKENKDKEWNPAGADDLDDDEDEDDEEGYDSDDSSSSRRRSVKGRRRLSDRGTPKLRPGKLWVGNRAKVAPNRPNIYGPIEDIEIGIQFPSRLDSCAAGIHRPTVAGIHGGPDGCYSIALSGGYEDDVDLGECFTYTGEGGRDLKGTKAQPKNLRTAPQSKDQELTRGNLALVKSFESGNPIRVIRGYKLDSPYAPPEGYRYDGLYKVEKYWQATGMSGFQVFKFAMKRMDNQAPPPWLHEEQQADDTENTKESTNDEENDAIGINGVGTNEDLDTKDYSKAKDDVDTKDDSKAKDDVDTKNDTKDNDDVETKDDVKMKNNSKDKDDVDTKDDVNTKDDVETDSNNKDDVETDSNNKDDVDMKDDSNDNDDVDAQVDTINTEKILSDVQPIQNGDNIETDFIQMNSTEQGIIENIDLNKNNIVTAEN